MPTYPSASVRAAREALGVRLKEMRLDAGLSAREVAERCGWHPSKASRLQSARTVPSDADIRAWCRVCAADDQAADLVAANRQADSMYTEWKRLHRAGMRRVQEDFVPLFEQTKTFRTYCADVIPGLVQTQEYTTALLRLISQFHGAPDDAEEAAAARVGRSHVIREGDHRCVLVMEEDVLHKRLGGAAVMAGQLGHLLSVMALPNVSFGIVPRTADRAIWPMETFDIFDDQRVHVELLSAQITVTSPGEITLYLKAFEELRQLAVYGSEARALVLRAIEAVG
ncbi:helix-turn-helix transcriptional regulator [Streptomyces synnematoformans]|uniref:Helix-turn-helix transcriptional regulator n=1 Tax=Streptomyces synnematoformans TaxID=415721 RepID=A0ABN1ZK12_9ACTN